MIIRHATSTDVPAIQGLRNAFLATTTIEWRDDLHTPDEVSAWIDEHDVVLVAEDGDEVVGVAAYGPFRDVVKRPGYRFTVENSVHVREDRWGNGVGRALMAALLDEARAHGKHVMVAAVDAENPGSIRFHERLGFVEVGRMPELGAKFGRWLELVLLQRRLDDRSSPGDR